MITGTDNGVVLGRVSPVFIEGRLSLPLVEAPIARQLGLIDGQVVQATVQARGEQLSLFLRGHLIEVPARQEWQAGQTLAFRVQVNTDGSLTLHPLSSATPPTPPSALAPTTAPVISRLGNLLFRPPGTPDTVALFRPGAMDAMLVNLSRPDLQNQLNAMRQSIASLTPDALRLALVGAMGSEISIAKGKRSPAEDPKQLLHKLLLAMGADGPAAEKDPGAADQIKGAMDEIEAAQVHAVQAQSEGALLFSMVLPFKDAAPIELSFERRAGAKDQQPIFTVNVHSNSPEYGELWLKTELHGKREVELVMWALRPGVAEQAREFSAALGLELQGAGLVMKSFQVIQGARPAQHPESPPSGCGLILDLQA